MKSYNFAYGLTCRSISRAIITAMLSVSLCASCAQHAVNETTEDFYTKMNFAPLDNAPFEVAYAAGMDALSLSLADTAVYAMASGQQALEQKVKTEVPSCPYLYYPFPKQGKPKDFHFDSDASKLHVEAFNTETSDAHLLVKSGTLLCQDGQTKKGMYLLDRNAAISIGTTRKLRFSEACCMPARVKPAQQGDFYLP